MMRKTMLLIFSLLLFVFNAIGQEIAIQVTVPDASKLQVLYLSDTGALEQELAKDIFQITFLKNGTNSYEHTKMVMQISQDEKVVLSAVSNEFFLPATFNPNPIVVWNADMINNDLMFDMSNPDTRVVFDNVNVDDNTEEFQKQVLSTGELPVGEYFIRIWFEAPELEAPIEVQQRFLVITNPSYVQLIGPGNMFGSGYAPQVYTQFPIFQFSGNGEEFQILVFEKKEMQSSVEDVLSSIPNWESVRFSSDEIHLNGQYPQVSDPERAIGPVIPLEYGKTYYWTVKMFVQTSSGEEVKRSELWQFRLVDPADADASRQELVLQQLASLLRDALGNQADDILKQLDGFDVKTILVNGQPMDFQDFVSNYRPSGFELSDLEIR